ncbi:MAG: gamma-glutamyl-gamma-aminobutyrate hydrolase family protein [Bacteroidales bacterium]|jgi:putative glutamine amidotransferase
MKTTSCRILFLFLLPVIFSFTPVQDKPVKIALSKSSPNYVNWIAKGDPSAVIIDLSVLKPDEAMKEMQECSALLLTGGGDINPAMYKDKQERKICTDIDDKRDKLEKIAICEALSLKMPILGICRGEQMLNVVLEGTLITDIPAYMKAKGQDKLKVAVNHQCEDYIHCFHPVSINPASFLHRITGADTGSVTSNHHQAIAIPGKGLAISAKSSDGITEAIEWKEPEGKSFLVGVQWHPERMDLTSALSGKLLERFLAEAKRYSLIHQNVK